MIDIQQVSTCLAPKSIVLTYHEGFVGDGILMSQDIYWSEFKKKSLFSHVALVSIDGFVYESTATIKMTGKGYRIVDGIKKTPLAVYLKTLKSANRVGVLYNFSKLSDSDWLKIGHQAELMLNTKNDYAFLELAGTLKTLLQWKFYKTTKQDKLAYRLLQKNNPYDKANNFYCVAFVEECFNRSKLLLCNPNVNNSVLTVDHIWYQKSQPCYQRMFTA